LNETLVPSMKRVELRRDTAQIKAGL
jgi:hypothetical protein